MANRKVIPLRSSEFIRRESIRAERAFYVRIVGLAAFVGACLAVLVALALGVL